MSWGLRRNTICETADFLPCICLPCSQAIESWITFRGPDSFCLNMGKKYLWQCQTEPSKSGIPSPCVSSLFSQITQEITINGNSNGLEPRSQLCMERAWFHLWTTLGIVHLPVILYLKEIWMLKVILYTFTRIIELIICFIVTDFVFIII